MPGVWFQEAQHMPKPVSPLAATTLVPAIGRGLGKGLETMGLAPGTAGARVEHGYAYMGFHDASHIGRPPTPEAVSRQHAAFAQTLRRWEREILPELRHLWSEIRALAPLHASNHERIDAAVRVREILERVWELHFALVPVLGGVMGLEQFLAQGRVAQPEIAAVNLLDGYANEIRDIDLALLELGALIEDDAKLSEIVQTDDAETLLAVLQSSTNGPIGSAFRALWPRIAERPTSFELFDPTWGEDPTSFARTLTGGRSALDRAQQNIEAAVARRDETERKVRAILPAAMSGAFEGLLSANRATWPLMQTHHYWMDELAVGLTRLAFLRIAEPLVGRGLSAREEVVFLRFEEVLEGLRSNHVAPGLVEARRRERETFLRTPPPPVLGEVPSAIFQDPMMLRFYGIRIPRPSPSGVLEGNPASGGLARGPARVVASVDELDSLAEGEILISVTTDPSWTLAMGRAVAIVTETGGILCHAAIVARERSVPAVTGAIGATRGIRTGDDVEVDGDRGIVRILTR